MFEIDAVKAQALFESLLDCVERGEEITINRHGEPVARMIGTQREIATAAAERIRTRAARLSLGRFDWATLKVDRDQGRR